MKHFERDLRKLWLIAAVLLTSPFCIVLAQNKPVVTPNSLGALIPLLHSEGVAGTKQVAPGMGWAMASGRLFWTNDNGAMWTDITPPSTTRGIVYNTFFLDVSHGWAMVLHGPGLSLELDRTEDSGRTWKSLMFEASAYADLKDVAAKPVSLWFVDQRHGWFEWKILTGSALSVGRLFATSDGGATWAELPEPPSAGEFQFYSARDGWMTGDAASDELWSTHDGGGTWQLRTISPPSTCKNCRPVFSAPRFRSPLSGALAVTFTDDSVMEGRFVHSSYATNDGGASWKVTEEYEQTDLFPRTGISSTIDRGAIRVFSDAKHGVQIRNSTSKTISFLPKEVSRRGSVAAADFLDETNGWLVYQAPKCYKFRNRAADGPGLPCLAGALRNDLLSTTDGGKTFRIITPSVSAALAQ